MYESKIYTVGIAMHSEEIKVYDLENIFATNFRNGISANYLSPESTTVWMQPNHFPHFVWIRMVFVMHNFLNRSGKMYRVGQLKPETVIAYSTSPFIFMKVQFLD